MKSKLEVLDRSSRSNEDLGRDYNFELVYLTWFRCNMVLILCGTNNYDILASNVNFYEFKNTWHKKVGNKTTAHYPFG